MANVSLTCSFPDQRRSLHIFFVRHGQTKANQDKIAAGQMHSPLTPLGISTAVSLRKALDKMVFHKFVASDMERTQQTAGLISPSAIFTLESRLREMAKGAREGYPKILSYEEALKERAANKQDGSNLPLLESDQSQRLVK
mmetsp:Transcript_4045/g.6324  ORF Transcript_4045/g.6324 Transcript_4045/m.6324 type:complete len:141 (+) Transcript_4045:74-496(+)